MDELIMKKDAGEQLRQDDLDMMKNPMTWHCWPILPIKKRNESGGRPEFGLLLATKKPVVYLVGMFDLGDLGIKNTADIMKKVKSTAYSSFEAILDDGWIVD
jgi:hypothetical protein